MATDKINTDKLAAKASSSPQVVKDYCGQLVAPTNPGKASQREAKAGLWAGGGTGIKKKFLIQI